MKEIFKQSLKFTKQLVKPVYRSAKSLLKKTIGKGSSNPREADSEKFCYYIEYFNYSDNILDLNGWIFRKDHSFFTDLFVCFEFEGDIAGMYTVELKERKDVQDKFSLKYADVGFSIKLGIDNFEKLDVFLNCKIDGSDFRIYIGKIKNTEDISDNAKMQIYPVASNSCYSISNLKNIQLQMEPEYPEQLYRAIVDIIVPIYNGYDYLRALLKSAVRTNMKYRFVFINDQSTDNRIEELLSDFMVKHPDSVYIKNDNNLGFVRSVNKGLQVAEHHVVLLNTDVEVPEMWLERLMYPIISDPKIGTTTPFTNCGTICSFPHFCEDNLIFADQSVDFVDSCFRRINPSYAEMPTGVGFCMGMNYQAIQDTGLLDADSFGRGYGEENDWCQRALKKGYKNVHVENLFVYHKHGGTFPSEEKQRLLKKNAELLKKKHPFYLRDVARYCRRDINKLVRQEALFECIKRLDVPSSLYFNHNLGGGATDYLQKKEKELLDNNEKYTEIIYDIYEDRYILKCAYGSWQVTVQTQTLNEIFDEIKNMKIDKVFINELVTYPDLYNILKKIIIFKNIHESELIMLVHDFFCVCPTINLLTSENKYCYLPSTDTCTYCMGKNANLFYREYGSIYQWRECWNDFLSNCTNIITFSQNSYNIIKGTYKSLNNISIVPHTVSFLPDISFKKKSGTVFNIGLLGILSERKGLSIVKDMLHIIEQKELDVNIILIGKSEEDIHSKYFRQTGVYKKEELPWLVCENDIDIFMIPSVWPETFSYTTEEIMKMGLPLAVFGLGAPMDRVRKYDRGLVISEISAAVALTEIMEFMMPAIKRQIQQLSGRKILCVAEYISFSSRYRLDHLREELFLQGISSEFCMLNKTSSLNMNEYTELVIYRCSDFRRINKLIKRAKQSNIKVYYDIDDYIFDFESIHKMEFLKDPEYKNYHKYCDKIRKSMELCDEYITSTNCLKTMIQRNFPQKTVMLHRNAASMEMLILSENTQKTKKQNTVVLGYFSGSRTHNSDFAVIEKILVDIMNLHTNVHLTIAGCLELNPVFDEWKDRITFLDFMDWRKLPEAIANIDINLMPLEDSVFHTCKSENKWMEAALVHVPTICSYNSELASVVQDGKTGVLCRNEQEWETKLYKMIEDDDYREQIATAAYEDAIQTHTTLTNTIQLEMSRR